MMYPKSTEETSSENNSIVVADHIEPHHDESFELGQHRINTKIRIIQ